jgi:exonuclease SbcD
MKVLHTSDWHLGRNLYGKKRYLEFSAFLNWLADYLDQNSIDALLVAGDVFDTTMPTTRAQQLYFTFLWKVASSNCTVVIVAGNHDSPSLLEAPQELLRALNVHVIGRARESLEEEVIELERADGTVGALVCAVPYLRDRELRSIEAGESSQDKHRKLVEGIEEHYRKVCRLAEERRKQLTGDDCGRLPIIAMGHLFAAGGKTLEDDGVRELYVGSLARVGRDIFPPEIDYLALGHLHLAQTVGGSELARYSGSPLPMGFGEATQQKCVVEIDCQGEKPFAREVAIPNFQELVRVSGNLEQIADRLAQLRKEKSSAWVEIDYTGTELVTGLRAKVDEMIEGSSMEIRRVRNQNAVAAVMGQKKVHEDLTDLNEFEVFERCLQVYEISEDESQELRHSYAEILRTIEEGEQDHSGEKHANP